MMAKPQHNLTEAFRAFVVAAAVLGAFSLVSSDARADTIIEHEGHTYKLIQTPTNWDDAKAAAESMSLAGAQGYLARIDSASENDKLLQAALANIDPDKLQESLANDQSEAPFIWLGGSDRAEHNKWQWIDNGEAFWIGDFNGSPVDGRYSNWGIQPDNATGNEDSLAMSLGDWPEPFYDLGSAGQWNDLDANNQLFYFVEFDVTSDLAIELEEPLLDSVHSGLGMVRGWAISSDGVKKIEVFLDGAHAFDLPHGGPHANIAAQYADIPGADSAGFSTPFNFSALEPGEHQITVRVTDNFGTKAETSATFNSLSFHKPYIDADALVELGWSYTTALGGDILIYDAKIDGETYDLVLRWSTNSQRFEIVDIAHEPDSEEILPDQ